MKRVVECWFWASVVAFILAMVLLLAGCGSHRSDSPATVAFVALGLVAAAGAWLLRRPAWRHCRRCGRFWHPDGRASARMPEECEGECRAGECFQCGKRREREEGHQTYVER